MESSTKTKVLKTEKDTSVHSSSADAERKPLTVRDVLHLEMVVQRVLLALPLSDMDAFLTVASRVSDVSWLGQDAALWEEMLVQHFGGRRDVLAEVEEPADPEMEEDDDGEDQDQDDEDPEEDEEELDDDEGDEDEEQENTHPVNTLAAPPPAEEEQVKAETEQKTETPPPAVQVDLPKWFASTPACAEATEFLVSAAEWQQFQQRVFVLRGDIGTIADVDGRPVDAIAFPGNAMLRTPYNGAAHIVFTRAGRELDQHTQTLQVRLRPGQSHVTPGFNTGARVLIHCHGPYMGLPDVYPTLARTYRSVLENAVQENVECLAMTSISTGNFGVPIAEATRTAVQTIHKFLRTHHEWQGRIGVVCYEGDVYEAFTSERDHVLASFNAAPAPVEP